MPTLHGASLSPFVRKVRVALAEKGIEYELNPVSPFHPPEGFRKISPLGKIPVFQDGEFTVPDSSVICLYLERKYPEPPLYPREARAYARALWYEEYSDTQLMSAAAPIFFNRVIKAKILKQPIDEERVQQQLTQALPDVFTYLEQKIAGQEFLADGMFSIADCAVVSHLQGLRHAGVAVAADRWPHLAEYAEQHGARPAFQSCFEEEAKLIASL